MRKGFAGLAAGVVGVLSLAALAPTAQAHPCAVAWTLENASFLSANNAAWGAKLPTVEEFSEADCAGELTGLYGVETDANAAADPVGDATSTHERTPNLVPTGFSARNVALVPSLVGINSDLAFKDNLVFQGHFSGFRVLDVTDPANPVQLTNYEACHHNSGQGDVIVYGNLLVRSWDSGSSTASHTCGGQPVGVGFEGIHLFDISNPAQPQFIRGLRMSATGNEASAPTGCGSHTATAVPDPARGYLYIYNGGSSGSCPGMDIVRIKLSDPMDTKFLRRAASGRSCHDNNVIMGSVNMAVCAGGNGLSVFTFDPSIDAEAEGGIANPKLEWSKQMTGVSIGHSASFSNDGKVLIYGHEPGGGTNPRCRETDSIVDRSLFFMDARTGDVLGTKLHNRIQGANQNCTWHNFNVVPTKGRNIAVTGNYQAGISVLDFTNPAMVEEIAYADPAAVTPTLVTAGDWSTYWHNGLLYTSDIRRGLVTWKLEGNEYTKRAHTYATSNPQTQMLSYEPDNVAPTSAIAAPLEGGQFLQNSQHIADYSCADVGLGVESCVGNVADGAAVDTSKIGYHTFTVTATDNAGNKTSTSVQYVVNSTAVQSTPGGTVPATLSLGLGTPASFGAFTPGIAREYTASTTANVISTAGDATLSASDPSSTNTGKLVNGSFTLAQPVQVQFSKSTWTGPVSNDQVTITFSQAIGANEALRTGTYSKTLTFTLSTTMP